MALMSLELHQTGKRMFDLVAAITLAIVTLPITLFVAFVLWIVQRRVLFRQSRPGLNGQPFTLYKFCSMNDARDKAGVLLPDDQRMTRIGTILRNMSLDELPQLWNVIKGEMSLVGPRPLLMEYLDRYTPEQARRHEVRPGITGWAQVNGRNAISWGEKFKLDVWYVDNASFALDLVILYRTFMRVVSRRGITDGRHATTSKFAGSMSSDKL